MTLIEALLAMIGLAPLRKLKATEAIMVSEIERERRLRRRAELAFLMLKREEL